LLKDIQQLFFIALLLATLNLSAQNPFIHHYTTSDGLPSNTLYSVFQDSKKFLWFGTDDGVLRFDGTNFISFRKENGLECSGVFRIKEDSYGRIWFFSYNGIINYFFHDKIFNRINAPFLDSLSFNINF